MQNHYLHVKLAALWNWNSWGHQKQSFRYFWHLRQHQFFTFLIWKNIWNYFNILYMLENLFPIKNITKNIIIRLVFDLTTLIRSPREVKRSLKTQKVICVLLVVLWNWIFDISLYSDTNYLQGIFKLGIDSTAVQLSLPFTALIRFPF